MLTFNIRFPH